MLENSADAAEMVTFEDLTVVGRGGKVTKKRVKVALLPERTTQQEAGPAEGSSTDPEGGFFNDLDVDMADPVPLREKRPQKVNMPDILQQTILIVNYQTQRDYIMEYVDNIDSLLAALLSREALPTAYSKCCHCTTNAWAVWRCQDCSLAQPLCRHCMRVTHQQSPLHKIQRWTGTHFRVAELWEVGTYMLVPHHQGEVLCDTLTVQKEYLEEFEQQTDRQEQERLGRARAERGTVPSRAQRHGTPGPLDDDMDIEPMPNSWTDPAEEVVQDEAYESYLNGLLKRCRNENDEDDESGGDEASTTDVEEEVDDATLVADSDVDIGGPEYLPQNPEDEGRQVPNRDAFNNSYVRIVHTNGLHHLALVSCRCRGTDCLPQDLLASRLLPTSFQNIRTLFSAHVLDYFRLCNLEMKASAYQFYHLLRRLTMPLAPGEVVDLYNEFRRMTRLWRWMKKLKWAGYGHNGKDPLNVGRGELANFCPACPQPGVNLPPNWKEDINR
jgi:CxC2 like cysteine cluster associated with KDZ transposases